MSCTCNLIDTEFPTNCFTINTTFTIKYRNLPATVGRGINELKDFKKMFISTEINLVGSQIAMFFLWLNSLENREDLYIEFPIYGTDTQKIKVKWLNKDVVSEYKYSNFVSIKLEFEVLEDINIEETLCNSLNCN